MPAPDAYMYVRITYCHLATEKDVETAADTLRDANICPHSGVNIPECSCGWCISALIERNT